MKNPSTQVGTVEIPRPVVTLTHGTPTFKGKRSHYCDHMQGWLYEDTETGGVCNVWNDSTFKTSFASQRFDSWESYKIWAGSICHKDSDHYRAEYCTGDLKRLRIEREWVEIKTAPSPHRIGRTRHECRYFCTCTETGKRLQWPNEVVHRFSKTDGYLPFTRKDFTHPGHKENER